MHLWYSLFLHPEQLSAFPKMTHIIVSRFASKYHGRGVDRQDSGYAFQFTLKGKGIFKYGEQEFELPPGTGFFRRVNDPLVEYYLPEKIEEPWEFIFCDLEEEGFRDMAEELIKEYGSVYQLGESHAFIQKLLSFRNDESSSVTLSLGENMQLVTDLVTALSQSHHKSQHSHPLIDSALKIIKSTDLRLLNVTYLAQQMEVSREHLTRTFKNQVKKSPYKLINEQRLRVAKDLLLSTDLEIQHIASQSGIGREQFSNWFRKQTELSPGEFRKTALASHSVQKG